MAERGGRGTLPLLCGSHERPGAPPVSVPRGLALVSHAVAAQPEYPPQLGPDEPVDCSLVACNPHPSSVSAASPRRYHLRQEPDADNPLVRIRGGGCGRP